VVILGADVGGVFPSPLAGFVARGLYPSLDNFYFALENEHLLHVPNVETVKFS